MSVADWAGVIAGVAGIATGGIAWRASFSGNKLAKKGHSLAEAANDTATDALGQAKEANRIAKDANQLAGDANTIAERALRVAQDDLPYRWVLEINDDGSAVVVNDCGHAATQAAITIDAGGDVVAQAGPIDIPAFGKVTFDVQSSLEKHFEEVRQHPYCPPLSGGGIFMSGSAGQVVSTAFRAHLSWLTEQQVPRTDVVQQLVSHYMSGEHTMQRTD
ncbi:hypothetical protein [Mycobacteroides abscessus]|uniref:hypothetical protein n=1 Tax=Mycobacteroides abscessus TaxID=36809 RepID=UPI00130000BC|nr:hypothetical protein [Mycobacteroides abscessus]